MQLLAASKSLMSIKGATGRYRMVEGNLLPKFNPTVRTAPGAPTVKAEPVGLVTTLRMENPATAPLETEPEQLSIKQVLDRAWEYLLKSGRSAFTTGAAAGSSLTGRLKKIKPLSFWKGRQLRGGAGKIKPVKSAVQGELSLDRVKVVRNDLSDTDLEIVPVANMKQSKSTEPVPMLANQMAPTETSWGRLATRIFGVRQTSI